MTIFSMEKQVFVRLAHLFSSTQAQWKLCGRFYHLPTQIFQVFKSRYKISSEFSMNWMTWNELWVICYKSAVANFWHLDYFFSQWQHLDCFCENLSNWNHHKSSCTGGNWYNLQGNHSLWRSERWCHAEMSSSSS